MSPIPKRGHSPDQQVFRSLAEHYAGCMDHRNAEMLKSIVTADAVIEGPGFELSGLEQILGIPAMLSERFRTTRHLIHNQVVQIKGYSASGETLCTASHLLKESDEILVWHIRYHDQFRCEDSVWRFCQRKLVLDWTQTLVVDLP